MDNTIISKLCNIEKGLEKIDQVARILDTILLGRVISKTAHIEIEKIGCSTSPQEDARKKEVKFDKMDQILESNKQIQERLASLEQNIKAIADNLHVKAEAPNGNTDQHSLDVVEALKDGNLNLGKEDWKRLKERLKEAVGYKHTALTDHAQKTHTCMDNLFGTWMPKTREGWREYMFGICAPDGRLGKEGSRSLLSSFARGGLIDHLSSDSIQNLSTLDTHVLFSLRRGSNHVFVNKSPVFFVLYCAD
jgi:hypothetical protein